MLEILTCHVVNSSDLWGDFSLAIQLLGSFIVAFFTVKYTQYLSEKRDFEATMVWLKTEGDYLATCMIPSKNVIIEKSKFLEKLPLEKVEILIINFPDFTLNSLDFIISKGYFQLLPMTYAENITYLKLTIASLKFNTASYNLLISKKSELSVENFKEQQLQLLKETLDKINDFNNQWRQFRIIKYPKSFIKYLW